MSADPRTTRSQDAHLGGALSRPPSRPDAPTESAVSAARPSAQPARKARPLGLGRGACNTSTAGITVSGESAMTSPSGMSAPSTEPQLSAMGSNHCMLSAPESVNAVVEHQQTDQDQDDPEHGGVVFFHPGLESFQRVIEAAAGLSPPVPIARPATAHRISTSSRTAVSTAPVTPARAGVSLENERIQ